MGRRSTEIAITKQAPHLFEEPAQIPGALLQDVRIVLGKAEHAVAVEAKQATYCEKRVAMIDKEELFGFLPADFAPAALMRQHRIVFFQGYPVALLETAPAAPLPFASGVDRIRPLGCDFLLVGLLVSSVGSALLGSKHWILCIFSLLPFTIVRHEFFRLKFCAAGAIRPETGRVKARDLAARMTPRAVEGPSGLLERAPRKFTLRARTSSAGAEDGASLVKAGAKRHQPRQLLDWTLSYGQGSAEMRLPASCRASARSPDLRAADYG
jgi:hypothetical protein